MMSAVHAQLILKFEKSIDPQTHKVLLVGKEIPDLSTQ